MRKTLVRFAIAMTLAVPGAMLAGCAVPPASTAPELTYRHLPPIRLAVGNFDAETRYIPPLERPNVEHLSPVPPYTAARQWGFDRIRSEGGPNRARLIILDASIVEKDLPVIGGLQGALQREQAKKYDWRIAVMLEILDPNRRQLAYVTARAERAQTMPEGTTLAEREKVWLEMTEAMMQDLNVQLEQNIQRYFAPYLVGS